LSGELFVVQIPEAEKMIDDGAYDAGRELPVTELLLDLGAAAGADGEVAVGGVSGAFDFLVVLLHGPK
jgi:hypothetical protein